ncbi:unnamed protein product, partial [Prorocentrum cordatum]
GVARRPRLRLGRRGAGRRPVPPRRPGPLGGRRVLRPRGGAGPQRRGCEVPVGGHPGLRCRAAA